MVGLTGDQDEIERLKNIFQIIDENKDGYLSFKEIEQADKKLNAVGLGSKWKVVLH